MEQQVHKKTSALTIVGIIVLILGFLGLLGTIYGSIAKDNMLSNLQSQIDSIDEQNAEIKRTIVEPYKAKTNHT